MSEIIIDPQAIENLRSLAEEGDDSFLREIIDIYFQDTPARLAELRALLGGGDTTAFVRAAHTIKGSSSNVGAEQVRAIAESLEHQARQTPTPPLDSMAPLVDSLDKAYATARTELEKLLG